MSANVSPAAGLTMIVPVFNEEKGIQGSLERLATALKSLPCPSEIIVVDDGSKDNTASVANAFPGITVLRHVINKGYGAAIKTGAAASRYPLIGIIDADGTYPAEELPRMLAEMTRQQADMAVGARTGKNVHIPLLRRPAKWVLSCIANYLTGVKIPDLNSGLRIMKKDAFMRFSRILPDGFSLTTTITLAMLTNALSVIYLPIDYLPRHGTSKIRPIHDTINFTILILRTMVYFQPLKVFVPASLFCFCASLGFLCYRIFIHAAFGSVTVIMFICGIQLLAIGLLADLINRRLS